MMNVAIWGATGATGSELLRRCLGDERIEGIRIFVRAPVAKVDVRVQQIVVGDFLDEASYHGHLDDVDTAFWCLGVSQSAVPNPKAYMEITVQYTVVATLALSQRSPGAQFHFVSAMGAKSCFSPVVMWARWKSHAEDRVADLLQSEGSASPGFSRVVVWRPGYILVPGGREDPGRWERRWEALEPLFLLVPGLVNPAPDIARAMLRDAIDGRTECAAQSVEVRTSRDITRLAGGR